MEWVIADLDHWSGNVWEFEISNGRVTVHAVAEVTLESGGAVLDRLSIQGPGANRLGWSGLRDLAQWTMETLDVEELRVVGTARTTGANPRKDSETAVCETANQESAGR